MTDEYINMPSDDNEIDWGGLVTLDEVLEALNRAQREGRETRYWHLEGYNPTLSQAFGDGSARFVWSDLVLDWDDKRGWHVVFGVANAPQEQLYYAVKSLEQMIDDTNEF
jgi:hypothetical protein